MGMEFAELFSGPFGPAYHLIHGESAAGEERSRVVAVIELGLYGGGAAGLAATRMRSGQRGLTVYLTMEEAFNAAAFERKISQLRQHVQAGNAVATIPHGVSDAARRNLTRKYRRALERRIKSFYGEGTQSCDNALQRLRQSDIDHILDLQLGGANDIRNLKTLHSATNQGLGRQISQQLPRDQRVPVIRIVVTE